MASLISPLPRPRRERRRRVERCLCDRGLLSRSRPTLTKDSPPADRAAFFARLRAALVSLGPLWSAFGRYLASRADLLPGPDCLELGEIRDRGRTLPSEAITRRLAEELGELPFASWEPEPFESRLFYQSHRARLRDGTPVQVRVLRPGIEADVSCDLGTLKVLPEILAKGDLLEGSAGDEVVADFLAGLEARFRLEGQADGLESLAAASREISGLWVPRVERELTTAGVLVLADGPGRRLEEVRGNSHALSARLAADWAAIWLRLALAGGPLVVEADLRALPDGRLALDGGIFAELSQDSRRNLWAYLRASAADDPDRAWGFLLRELPRSKASQTDELRVRMCQAAPFRDGSWSPSGGHLAEHLVLHWRFARRCGIRPAEPLQGFFKGLFQTARQGQALAPGVDPLAEGLERVAWLAGWTQTRQRLTMPAMGKALDGHLMALVTLPGKLHHVLGLLAEHGAPGATADPPRRRRGPAAAIVLVLLLAALAWTLSPSGRGGSHEDLLSALAFLILGALAMEAVRTR